MHQYATLEDTVYLGFAANLTSGAAGDGASPLFDVRLGGAAAGAAPVLSGTPTLLTNAAYTDGCYEVAIAATAANGFAAGNTYLVFVTLTIDSVTPAAMIGSFRLAPVPANVTQLGGVTQSLTDLKDFADDGYDPATNKVQGVVLVDTLTTYTGNTVQTGDSFARLGAPAGASVSADILVIDNFVDGLEATIGAAGAGLTALATQASVNAIDDFLDTEISAILADTNELQTDWANGGRLDLILDARSSQSSVDTIDGIVDAILTDTAEIGAAGAGLTVLATAANLATVAGYLDTEIAAILEDTGTTLNDKIDVIDGIVDSILADTGTDGVVVAAASKSDYALSSAGVTAIWAEVMEGAVTAVQMMRGFAAAILGKASGLAGTTAVYRDLGDTKDRITATVDANGNRTAVTRDLT